mmetsp:Transcript_7669/g.21823  ORF Transcript_7669/g.21823 Transcript_7669/m.21823 type:complete len:205 (-) Transcript_7669:7-621(-)
MSASEVPRDVLVPREPARGLCFGAEVPESSHIRLLVVLQQPIDDRRDYSDAGGDVGHGVHGAALGLPRPRSAHLQVGPLAAGHRERAGEAVRVARREGLAGDQAAGRARCAQAPRRELRGVHGEGPHWQDCSRCCTSAAGNRGRCADAAAQPLRHGAEHLALLCARAARLRLLLSATEQGQRTGRQRCGYPMQAMVSASMRSDM